MILRHKLEKKGGVLVKAQFAQLEHIRNEEPVTPDAHKEFFCKLQQGLLLALQEQEIISREVCQKAEERLLKRQKGRQ